MNFVSTASTTISVLLKRSATIAGSIMDSKGCAGDTASNELDYLIPFIQRNIVGPLYPESMDQPSVESRRTHFFYRGKLILWPNAECLTCDLFYSLNQLGKASEDPQDNTLECPGCKARLKLKIRVTGIDLMEGQKTGFIVLNEETTEEQEQFMEQPLDQVPFCEVVDYYTGKKQLYLALTKLYLATPLIFVHGAEMFRKQPTLAYNLLAHDCSGFLDRVFDLFQKASVLENSKNSYKEVNPSSMGDILPADHPGMQSENSDYKTLEQKDFKEPSELQIKGPWVTMVWRDRRSEQDGEVAYRLLTYEEMDPEICVKTQLLSKEKWTTKEIFYRIQLFIQELPFFEGSWIELCGSLHEIFDPELYWFDYTFMNGFTNFNFLGEDGEHKTDREDCPKCLILVDKERKCFECGYQLKHWKEIDLYLIPCDDYGYRYELAKSIFLDLIGLDRAENRVSFDEVQLLITDTVLPLIRHCRIFKYSQITVSCPEIPFRFIHSLDEYRVQVKQMPNKQNFEKLLDYIEVLKQEYNQIPQNYDFYRSALTYVEVPLEKKKAESVDDSVPENPRKLENSLYIAQAKVVEKAIIQQMEKEKKEETLKQDYTGKCLNIISAVNGIASESQEAWISAMPEEAKTEKKKAVISSFNLFNSIRNHPSLIYVGKLGDDGVSTIYDELSGTEVSRCDKCGTIIRWQGGECWNCTVPCNTNREKTPELVEEDDPPELVEKPEELNDLCNNCSQCSGGTAGNICPDCEIFIATTDQ